MAKNVRTKPRHGKYQVLYPHEKTGNEVSAGTFQRKKDAEAKKREITNRLYNLMEVGRAEKRTVADLLDACILDWEARHRMTVEKQAWREKWSVTGDTLRNYQDIAERFIRPILGPFLLIALTIEDCQSFVDEIDRRISAAQARKAGELLRLVLRFGDERQWKIEDRLLRLLSKLRLPPKPKRKSPPSKAQLTAILEVIYGPRPHKVSRQGYLYRRAMWLIVIANGPRRGEIAAMRWEGVDWQNGTILVDASYSRFDGIKEPKTAAGIRLLDLSPDALEALAEINRFHDGPRSGLVFKPITGKSIYASIPATYVRPVLRQAGLVGEDGRCPFNLHYMRHVASSLQAELGVSLKARMAGLGHVDERAHHGYTHMLAGNQEVKNAVTAITQNLLPAIITPTSEAMKLKQTGYHRMDREQKRAYHREYMKAYRAKRSGQGADNAK